jgi:hypothetical protein
MTIYAQNQSTREESIVGKQDTAAPDQNASLNRNTGVIHNRIGVTAHCRRTAQQKATSVGVLDFTSGRWTQQRVASTISRGLTLRDRRGKVLLRRSSKSSRRSRIPEKKYRDRTKVCQCARAGTELAQKAVAKIRSQIRAELLCRRQPKWENEH